MSANSSDHTVRHEDNFAYVAIRCFPYVLYIVLAIHRYLKFENVGTFNIKWKLMWPTRIKLLLASMLLIINTYEFLTVMIGGIS